MIIIPYSFRAFNAGGGSTALPTVLRCASFTPQSHLDTAFSGEGHGKNTEKIFEKSGQPTNAIAVSGAEDGSLLLFDLERNWKPCIDKLSGHSKPIVSTAFSQDVRYLASADTSGQIIVWKKS